MAMFKDVLGLIDVTITKDALKQDIITEHPPREVFANKKSIAQSEFFSAGQTGIKAAQLFEIRLVDYAEEMLLTFNNKEYSIYRTFEKGENIELYCEVRIGGNKHK